MPTTRQRSKTSITKHFLALCLSLCLGGCFATSQNPIIDNSGRAYNPALFGLWHGSLDEGDDPFYLHMLAGSIKVEDQEIPAMTALIVTQEKTPEDGDEEQPDKAEWGTLDTATAQIGDNGFLSFHFTYMSDSEVDEDEGYHLFHYSIETTPDSPKQLILTRLSDDVLEQHIENGNLEGEISGGQWSSSTTITASSQALASFIDEFFDETFLPEDYGKFSFVQNPSK